MLQHDFNIVRKTIEFYGQTITIETGRIARQAGGAVLISQGETTLLVTAVGDKEARPDTDFFPLTVDFIEKMYSAGKVPGGFFKREAKPSTQGILNARLIDRSIRPLFPDGYRNSVHVVVTVLSYDEKADVGSLGITGASLALSISDIPFNGPIAGVTMGWKDGAPVVNPDMITINDESELNLNVAGSQDSIVMIEAGAKELSEEQMIEAMYTGHKAIQEFLEFAQSFMSEAAKPKIEFEFEPIAEEINSWLKQNYSANLREAVLVKDKKAREQAIKDVKNQMMADLEEQLSEEEFAEKAKSYKSGFGDLEYNLMRDMILEEELRADGRDLNTVRPISIELDLLARVHGSALFTRGETQSLGTVTLGTSHDEKIIDGMDEEYRKHYYLHYNFPPFSVGETGFMRAPGRRELGHGALAERALLPLMPNKDEFPYTVRIVSEIMESNGSSSMASVCSGCLSMMAAGVPVKKHVAGIANGLIMKGDNYKILTDIIGMEDHLGDMDFKVTGTVDGITAMQMDIKISGINRQIMQEALAKANVARNHIIGLMKQVISEPRTELSPYAPRIETMKIEANKIAEVIGSGGKTIKAIVEETKVQIEIQDDGTVVLASPNLEGIAKAREIIFNIVSDPEYDAVYPGVVQRVEAYGVFVKFMGNKTGLVHVSQMHERRVNKAEDLCKVGDEVKVRFIGMKDFKYQLGMKGIEGNPNLPEGYVSEARPPRTDRDDRNDRGRDNRGRYDRNDRGGNRGGRR